MAKQTVAPGWYKHFKGNRYEVLGEAVNVTTETVVVVYRNIEGQMFVRPLGEFLQQAYTHDWQAVPRFQQEITDERVATRSPAGGNAAL